jgi:outer membrane protein TolC
MTMASPPSPARRWLPLVAILALVASASSAEATPSAELTLDEALAVAARNNETPAIARERMAQADGAAKEAYAIVLPTVTANAALNRARLQGTYLATSAGLTVSVFDPSSLPRLKEAFRLYDAQLLDAGELKRAFSFVVANTFVNTIATDRLTEAASRRLVVTDEALHQARINAENGLVARNEVTRSEVSQATAALELTRDRSVAAKARLSLAFLLGIDLTSRALAPPPEPAPEPRDQRELVAAAVVARRDLESLRLRSEAASAGAITPRTDALPKLSLTGSYSDSDLYGGPINSTSASVDTSNWSVGLVATWTLYDGGARFGRIDRLDAVAREAGLQYRAARRQLDNSIATALEDLTTARATVAQAEVKNRAAKQNLDEVDARFANGLATAFEQSDAIVTAFEAEVDVTSSRLSLYQAQLSLAQQLGRWPTTPTPPGDRP